MVTGAEVASCRHIAEDTRNDKETDPVTQTLMRQTLMYPCLCLLLLLPLSPLAAQQDGASSAAHAGDAHYGDAHYGDGVTLETTTPIAAILGNPDAFAGSTVRVEGRITEVCQRKGCWMQVEDAGGHVLRVKVQDDVIVFTPGEVGRQASAQGEVKVFDLSREDYQDWLRHVAEEQGREYDPASVGDGPYRMVQLQGTGAVTRPEESPGR